MESSNNVVEAGATQFIDSHFHSLMMRNKGLDVRRLLGEAFAGGLYRALDIGTTPEDLEERLEMAEKIDAEIQGPEKTGAGRPILHSAGIYPGGSAEDFEKELLPSLEKALQNRRVAALGEFGIDLHWNYAPPGRQQELMRQQILLANRYGLPVVIHSRKADRETLEVLRSTPPEYGGIMHCFSSGYDTAKACIDLGLYISFAGNVTYKNAGSIREAAGKIPVEKILLETDAPYLSPEPHRGRRNHPLNVVHIYRAAAELRGVETAELMKQVCRNFDRLFPPER